jgi:hypothetical protein
MTFASSLAPSVNADAVVRERQIRQRRCLSHAARQAVLIFAATASRRNCARDRVPLEASRGIKSGVARRVLMRVVASDAAELTTLAKAPARHQTNRLEPHRHGILQLGGRGRPSRLRKAMAPSAELRRRPGGETSWIEDRFPDPRGRVGCARRLDMEFPDPWQRSQVIPGVMWD